jgi:serpin B
MSLRMLRLCVMVTTAFLMLMAVSSAEQVPAPQQPAPITEEVFRAAAAGNQFSIDLYRQLAASEAGNVCCSGHSVASVFLMAAAGARADAKSQIAEILNMADTMTSDDWSVAASLETARRLEAALRPVGGKDRDTLRARLKTLEQQWATLRAAIKIAPGEPYELIRREHTLVDQINALRQQLDPYELNFANALWCDSQFPLRPELLATIQQAAVAQAYNAEFRAQPDAERERINEWVAAQTNQRITDLLGPGTVDPLTRLILTNAVYFKGEWKEPFDEGQTQDHPFTLATSETATVPLMNQWQWTRFVELRPDGTVNELVKVPPPAGSPFEFLWQFQENPNGVKLLELPYKGDAMSMLFILPNRADGLAAVESALSNEQLAEWQSHLAGQTVRIGIPRFELRTMMNLNQPLQELGLTAPYELGALSGWSEHPEARDLAVGLVIQQTFVLVNEKGTEAAAATALLAPASAAFEAPKPDPEFIADHPFLFCIRHNATGAILFLGRYSQPE